MMERNSEEFEERAEEGRVHGNRGQSLSDIQQTIENHKQDLSIAKEVGNRAQEGRAYRNLGLAYRSLGDVKQAIEYHKQDLCIAKEVGDRAEEGRAYGNLGDAYRSLGDVKQAIEYHKQDLSIAKEVGDRAEEGRAYGNLGDAYRSLGDVKKAIEYHKQDLSIAKEVGDRAQEGRAYGNLGVSYRSLGNLTQAHDYHTQYLSIAKEVGDRAQEGRAYGNLGLLHNLRGDFEQAIDYHKRDLSIAKEVGDRAEEGRAYGNLGDAYRSLGDVKRAIEYLKQDLCIAKEVGDRNGEGEACYSLGCVYDSSGSLHEALDYYRSSVQVYNNVRASLQSEDALKRCFRKKYQHVYTALLRTLLKLGKTDEALFVAEQGRAQALTDLMEFQYGLGWLPAGLSEPKETISHLLSEVSPQTLFISLETDTLNLWLLKGKEIHYERKEIEYATQLVDGSLKDISNCYSIRCENRSLEEPHGEVRQLHDAIIGPFANVLQGDELIIVPDGPLCLAPYAGFLDDASKYLGETTRIRIIPSLTSLHLIASCPEDYHSKSGALLVGDPCMKEVTNRPPGLSRLNPMPGAREEVQIIGKIFNTTPLMGKDATKDEVLKRITSVALVHIATHTRSATGEIVLAPNPTRTSKIPEEKDYMLNMADVLGLQLRARLVVLSGSYTAKGEITPEGVVGIARAFLGAGARSVLASLWGVEDEATIEFMRSFYQHLADGKSASVAHYQAIKCLRESEKLYGEKYWAPFVLIGDDVTLEVGESRE